MAHFAQERHLPAFSSNYSALNTNIIIQKKLYFNLGETISIKKPLRLNKLLHFHFCLNMEDEKKRRILFACKGHFHLQSSYSKGIFSQIPNGFEAVGHVDSQGSTGKKV